MPCDRPRSEARYEQVVARASRGDQAATEELLDVLRPRLESYCRRVLRDAHRLPQVLEATLADVVSALPGMRERRAPFPSWAYGLAAQRVRAADDHRDLDLARDLIAQLTDLERVAVAGTTEGRSIDEIAASGYLSPAAVHVAYVRAMARFRAHGRGLRMRTLVGELLREGDGEGPEVAGSEEDRSEEGDLDLHAARAALRADLRATLRDHEVVSSLDRAEAEVRAETSAPSAALRPADTVR